MTHLVIRRRVSRMAVERRNATTVEEEIIIEQGPRPRPAADAARETPGMDPIRLPLAGRRESFPRLCGAVSREVKADA